MDAINLGLHDEMVRIVEKMPKTHLWDYLPIRKGIFKLIPTIVYIYAFYNKYPDD